MLTHWSYVFLALTHRYPALGFAGGDGLITHNISWYQRFSKKKYNKTILLEPNSMMMSYKNLKYPDYFRRSGKCFYIHVLIKPMLLRHFRSKCPVTKYGNKTQYLQIISCSKILTNDSEAEHLRYFLMKSLMFPIFLFGSTAHFLFFMIGASPVALRRRSTGRQ